MATVIDRNVVDAALSDCEIDNLNDASIRQLSSLARIIEQRSSTELIHFEIGSPGLPASPVGVEAECEALRSGVASVYPPVEGVAELKTEASRFIATFIGTSVSPKGCIPTVGSMQGTLASMMLCSFVDSRKDTILLVNPGFSVNRSQAVLLGIKVESFDLNDCRDGLLGDVVESYLSRGNIAAILYSNPNNPTWMCLSDEELQTIARLADRYDTVVIEDLAYLGMDFRRSTRIPFAAQPCQVSVSHYTDNYIMLLSASKIFSYAGQRIAVAAISDKLYSRRFPELKSRFGISQFGAVFVQRIIYCLTSGVSHSAQCALAAMMKAANEGRYNFVDVTKEYARRTRLLKEIFVRHGFDIIYHSDLDEPLGDGFFFTIGFRGVEGDALLRQLLCYGICGILLSTTGSVHQGLRICSSAIREHHYALLDERLTAFVRDFDSQTATR